MGIPPKTGRARRGLTPGLGIAAFAFALLGVALIVGLWPLGVGAVVGPTVSAEVPAQALAERMAHVAVNLDDLGSDTLKSAQVQVTYDPALLAPRLITAGDPFTVGCTQENSINPAAGVINLFFDCDTARSGNSLSLWDIEFFVGPVAGPTGTDLIVGNLVLLDEHFQNLDANAANGATEIIGGQCGDHNDDGSVNVLDSIRNLQFGGGLAEPDFIQAILGDLNFDSGIDLSDGDLLLNAAVGLSAVHECGELIFYDDSVFESTQVRWPANNPATGDRKLIPYLWEGIYMVTPEDCPECTTAIAMCPECLEQDSGDDVLLHSGELIFHQRDLEIPGRGFNWKFERTYRSGGNFDGPLGQNWELNYGRRLTEVNGSNLAQVQQEFPGAVAGDVVRMDGYSRADLYTENPDGSYNAPLGYYTRLVKNPDGTFTEHDASGSRAEYGQPDPNGLGLLEALSDRDGNVMALEHDQFDRLSRVIDTLGRPIDYIYGMSGHLGQVCDFSGRCLGFQYDVNGNLVGVTSPVVTGTPNGNDFPSGKTEQYSYSSGFLDEVFNHNLLTVTAPNEVASAGPARVQFVYNEVLGSADEDRVLSQTWGGTNATGVPAGGVINYVYALINPPPVDLIADPFSTTTVTDRNGNETEYTFNLPGNILNLKELTNRNVRPSDPLAFETPMTYNADGELEMAFNPLGNQLEISFDTANPNRLGQGNPLSEIQSPDARGGDQALIAFVQSFEPIYNQVRTITGPRGIDPAFQPPIGLAGEILPNPSRYTTTFTFDYQEDCDFAAIGDKIGQSAVDAEALLTAAGLCGSPLGDVNGDGVTDQVNGNVIRVDYPTVNLLAGSNQAVVQGDTTQEIFELNVFNDFGQLVGSTDPEGNVTSYEYYPEQDPNGDGIIDNPLGDPVTGGYLKQITQDTTSDPDRNSGTDPTPTNIRSLYEYDPVGNVTRQIDGRGIATDYVVNQLNQVVQIVWAADHDLLVPNPAEPEPLTDFQYLSRTFYDFNDNVVLLQLEDRGNTSQVDGNPPVLDLPAVVADPDPAGGTAFVDTIYQYDILDQMVGLVQEVGVGGNEFLHTGYRYDPNGNPALSVYPEGNAVASVYDERDLLFQSIQGATAAPALALLAATDPLDYDARGGAKSTITYRYDLNTNLVEVVDASDTDFSEDNNSDFEGIGDRTRYIYDGFDRLTSRVDSEGNQTLSQYDPANNLVRTSSFGPVTGSSRGSDGPDMLLIPVSDLGTIQSGNLVNTTLGLNPNVLLAATEASHDELSRTFQSDQVLFVNTIPTVRTPDLADGATDLGKGDLTPGDNQAIPGISGVTILGRVSNRVEYDRNSRSTFQVQDDLDTSTTLYDGVNRVIQTIDPESNAVAMAYDDNHNLIELEETDVSQVGGVADEVFLSTNFYDSLDRLDRNVDNLGQTTDYRYDSRSNLVAIADAQGPLSGGSIVRRNFADGARTVNAINDFGNVNRYFYDGLSRTTQGESILTASGQGDGINAGATLEGIKTVGPAPDLTQAGGDGIIRTGYLWDQNSLQTAQIDDQGNATIYLYDNQNRGVAETKGVTVNTTPLDQQQIMGSNIIPVVSDDLSDPFEIPTALVNLQLADAKGRLNAVAGLFPSLADQVDNPTSIIYGYDRDSNATQNLDENETTVDFDFDALNRRTFSTITPQLVDVIGTTQESWEYDGLSRIVAAFDENETGDGNDDATITFAYDSRHRVIEETQQIGSLPVKVNSTAWRAEDLRSGVTYPNGRVIESTYDDLDRINSISDQGAGQPLVDYDYLGRNRIAERDFPINGIRETYLNNAGDTDVGYDGLRRVVQLRDLRGDNSQVVGFGHSYDRRNNKLSQDKLHNTANDEEYGYDSVYRLIDFDRPNGGAITPIQTTWDLDGVGNWTQVDGEVREHSNFNEIIQRDDGGVTLVASDNNGNQTDDGTFIFQWDYKNRLRTVTRKSDTNLVATYVYDAMGRRIRKVVTNSGPLDGTTDYYYDGWQVVEERDGADILTQQYVYGIYIDEPLVLDRNLDADNDANDVGDQRLFYHQDAQSSTFALTDAAGVIVEGYQYDAYGLQTVFEPGANAVVDFGGDDVVTTAGSSVLDNPYTYTGRRLDPETGLYYYRTRYMDTEQGRFKSRDPLGSIDGLNLYEYVGSSPANWVDSHGMDKKPKEGPNRACQCCCVEDLTITAKPQPQGVKGKDGGTAGIKHVIDTEVKLSYKSWNKPEFGNCRFEWWEKTDLPAFPFIDPNEWTDFSNYPSKITKGGVTYSGIDTKAFGNAPKTGSKTPSKVTDQDSPELGRGKNRSRNLKFEIRVISAPGCPCAKSSMTAYVEQYLWWGKKGNTAGGKLTHHGTDDNGTWKPGPGGGKSKPWKDGPKGPADPKTGKIPKK